MGRVRNALRRLFRRRPAVPVLDVEELRLTFMARYHSFKLLLEANRKSLETMAEMERTLSGGRSFGMDFVRGRCTRIATQVWQMIRHLGDLAPGRYGLLGERHRAIQARIQPLLAFDRHPVEGELVLPLHEVRADMAGRVGAKMASLGEIHHHLGLPVPTGFVVTVRGFARFMEHSDLQTEIDRRLQAAGAERIDHLYELSENLRKLIVQAEVPGDLRVEILEQYRRLEKIEGEGITVAVRSSALHEDVPGASFAGQYGSELNVEKESLLEAYKAVVASKYDLAAMTNRLKRGIRDGDMSMCVGVLTMVDALAGGVLYSRDPVKVEDDSVIVNSAWGLPAPVAAGNIPVDVFVIGRGEPLEIRNREVPAKPEKYVCLDGGGVSRTETADEERTLPSLSDGQVLELARMALRLERYAHAPQDIEWAVRRDGTIILLQCRPLQFAETDTAASRRPGEAGPVMLRGGVTASPGAAAGPVCIVETDEDALRFPAGGILVIGEPLPRWAALLDRAAAVVAERGHLAGHLASVSRELGMPALFGLAGAVGTLVQDLVITLDAGGRVIYRGRVEALLAPEDRPRHFMEGSPVYEALRSAVRQITPLHLLDPDAPDFRPERCESFHDITRFCHEKAVQEMFRFGKDHHFPERSSKQLYCDVPMQWWVLNLDDGFTEEIQGRYVRLEQIASIPMQALWDGITSVPWEGPPPMDGKGFMSVLFGATTNTALTTGIPSRYADRNYFMLSRHYCCLQSRLGAHFSIVEALVGERVGESYINFQFKGGAADQARRLRRVEFIRDVLAEYGFHVNLHEDNVIARLEGHRREFMEGRLRILGYLTIHTRQLDMIMARPEVVSYYRDKMHGDIGNILSGE